MRLCAACGEYLDHISQCEKDGHRAHHHVCCPIPCRPGTTTSDLSETLTCTHGWRQADDTWVHA